MLVPYDQPPEIIMKLLPMANADFLIASAGVLSLTDVKKECPNIREFIWVVEKTSREMDWNEEGASVWHELVEQQSSKTIDLPESSPFSPPPELITIWLNDSPSSGEIVAFTQQNIVSALHPRPNARRPLLQRIHSHQLRRRSRCRYTSSRK